jgi:hypothetical protein
MRSTALYPQLYRQTRTPEDFNTRLTSESSTINSSALTLEGGGGGANPTEVVDVTSLESTITNAPIIENPVPPNSSTPVVVRTIPIPASVKGKKCILYGFLQLYTPSAFAANLVSFRYGLQIDDEEIKFGDAGTTEYSQTTQSLYAIGAEGRAIGTSALNSLQPISFPVTIPSGAKELKITIRNTALQLPVVPLEVQGAATTFSYTGALQNYTVPAGVNNLYVFMWGGGGGGGATAAGAGAFVSGTYQVSPGQIIRVVVGKSGPTNSGSEPNVITGGGGRTTWSSAGGGGFSGIFTSTTLTHGTLIACAGAGGGSGPFGVRASSGGVTQGGTDAQPQGSNPASTPGTQSAGGLAGGGALTGGNAVVGSEAGGGGGGYYGGGGSRGGYSAGSGGSSYIGGFTTFLGGEDGGPFTNSTRLPGGITNQYYISPRGRESQPGQVTIVQATTLSPVRINANIKLVAF